VLADIAIFTKVGGSMLSRWGHFLGGITWIGILYYFNFVQVPSFAELDAQARTAAVDKLVPRALWWFRWGAAVTLVSGLLILGFNEQFKGSYFRSAPGTSILTGILLGVTMFLNVWLVIWPNQKVVIASARSTLAGGEPDPNAAGLGRKALLASRTNTLFSIPLLFFMGATSHLAPSSHFSFKASGSKLLGYWIIVGVLWAAVELNALGFIGGTGAGPTKQPLERHQNTIVSGFVLTLILYILFEIFLKR
jgi:uncharacterized membrane protein